MNIPILIGIGTLIVGVVISRLIQGSQLRRLESAARTKVFAYTRRIRVIALIPALVAVVLFIIGFIVIPEAFAQLLRLMIWVGGLYVIVLNIFIFVAYIRARCGIWFIIVALIAKGILFAALIVFCYVAITTL